MADCRPTNSKSNACAAPLASNTARSGAQVALRMAQYKRAARRHPRAAMGALAHWLRSLDQAQSPPSAVHTVGEVTAHGTPASKCAASQPPATTSQK